MAGKRILITGLPVFRIASIAIALYEGDEVIAMDNLITGSLQNIEHLFKLKSFEFYHHDVNQFVHVRTSGLCIAFCFTLEPDELPQDADQTLKVGSLGYS